MYANTSMVPYSDRLALYNLFYNYPTKGAMADQTLGPMAPT